MSRWYVSVALGFLVLLAGCQQGDLTLVGYDSKGKTVEAFIDKGQYAARLKDMLLGAHHSVLPVLNAHSRQREDKKWDLQLAVVGFGVKASVGFGPFQAGITPGIRAFFTNQITPPPLP